MCAIVVVMGVLLLPSISGYSSTYGRRAAVNVLMNTFEQARVAALESGQTVYVAFADDDGKLDLGRRYAAFLVFREATDEERDPDGDGDTSDGLSYVILRKWTPLPKNIAFKRIDSSLVPSDTSGNLDIDVTALNKALPAAGRLTDSLPGIAFNSSGAIQSGQILRLYLYEGYYLNGQDNFTRNAAEQGGGLFECISFSRYTGRPQLDIRSTQ